MLAGVVVVVEVVDPAPSDEVDPPDSEDVAPAEVDDVVDDEDPRLSVL